MDPAADNPSLHALRARNTRLIFLSTALGSTSLYAAFTFAPLIVTDLTGSRSLSGVPGAVSVAGAAVGAAGLSAVMVRRGRVAGLRLGYAIGIVGAAGAVAAVRASSFALLILTMTLIGIGHASNYLGRFAAAELHPASRRPTILGWIVWASTIGAAAGPTLPRAIGSTADALDLPPEAAGFLVAFAFFLVASIAVALLRSDPRLAFEEPGDLGAPMSVRLIAAIPSVRAALVAMLVAQTTMVLVMTMTPVHVREHGHGLDAVGLVMSAHFVGMFAFSPVAGRLVTRVGSRSVMLAGLGVLIAACIGVGFTSGERSMLTGVWLFVLGLGWSLTFVAGSSALAQGLPYRARVKIQGSVDSLAWAAAASASLLSGALLEWFGFRTLALAGAVLAVLPFVFARPGGATGAPSIADA